ncbi:hypothetical protein BGZ65_001689 [Modicella reniformis]|uniref:Uncharacterized protein n=1 Tax=Modicella reniformis TaxID=1440133 RepID=A0A9P6MIX3_9FUNG|nr:hypothetical protein BGZ65_001689 [Modicella reniformis]
MVLTKPTTVRQRSQLKTMRKHHWEFRTEIEHQLQLRKNTPTMYSHKIARTQIDWEVLRPVTGTTLCEPLEQWVGLAHKKLLVSWGLTDIDARRFTSHLWEVMVAAVEADLRGSKGFGLRVRHTRKQKTIGVCKVAQ